MERSSADAEVIWSVGGVLYRIAPGTDSPYEIVPEYADGAPEMVDEEGRGVWRFDARSADKALELLGRHLGMFTDRIEADVRESVKVVLFGGE